MSAWDVLTPLIFTASVTAAVFAGVIWSRRWSWTWKSRRREKRANQTPEEVWRELLGWRIVHHTVWMLWFAAYSAAWLWGARERFETEKWLVWATWGFGALFIVSALRSAWSLGQAVRRGWVKEQDTELGRRARELVDQAVKEKARQARAEGESC